jgi:hypothetical protein
VTTFSTVKPAESPIEPSIAPENLTFRSKLQHFEQELDLRKSLADKLAEKRAADDSLTTSSFIRNNNNLTKSQNHKLPVVSNSDLKQMKENLLKTTNEMAKSTFLSGENTAASNTRNIPIKIQTQESDQNGDWKREAFRIEPLSERGSVSSGDLSIQLAYN